MSENLVYYNRTHGNMFFVMSLRASPRFLVGEHAPNKALAHLASCLCMLVLDLFIRRLKTEG